MTDRFDTFSEPAKKVIMLAQEEAQRFNHSYVGTEHLLLALVREGDDTAAKALAGLGIVLDRARRAVEFIIGRGHRMVTEDLSLNPNARNAIDLAIELSKLSHPAMVTTANLLDGIVHTEHDPAAKVLSSMGITPDRVRAQLEQVTQQRAVLAAELEGPATPATRSSGRGMTPREIDTFLAGPWNARVGCLTESGAPYVVPAWYEWDGQVFWLVPRARAAWARYLQRDGRVSLCIDQEEAPHRRILVAGRAEIVEPPNVKGRWVSIAERMALRYLGPVNGPRYLVPTLDRPRWLIRVRPEKMTSWAGGDWHPRYLNN